MLGSNNGIFPKIGATHFFGVVTAILPHNTPPHFRQILALELRGESRGVDG